MCLYGIWNSNFRSVSLKKPWVSTCFPQNHLSQIQCCSAHLTGEKPLPFSTSFFWIGGCADFLSNYLARTTRPLSWQYSFEYGFFWKTKTKIKTNHPLQKKYQKVLDWDKAIKKKKWECIYNTRSYVRETLSLSHT